MADPLSVAASIVGILAAAGKVIEIMGPYMSAVRDTPKIAVSVHSEVVNSRIVLSALHGLLDNLSTTSINRKLLVSIDDLVAVFTNGVFIFSELESSVSPMNLGASDRIMARMQWARKEGKLSAILERLHTFKETMMLLLNILQCGSDHRAVQNQDELSMKISGLMQEHVDLCRLLETNSDSFDALSIIESRRPAEPQRLSDDVSELQCFSAADTTKSNPGHSIPVPESSPIPTLEFQTVLDLSRPYKRARNGSIDCPTRTSVAASKAGSIFSGISLSEVSILSRIAIPVYPADISNSHHYEFMPSTVAKVYTARRPTAATIGRWAELVRRIAVPREFRFDIQFEVPLIFLCPPTNITGPIEGKPIFILDGSQKSLDESRTSLPQSFKGIQAQYAKQVTNDENALLISWLTMLSAIQQMEYESRVWQKRMWEEDIRSRTQDGSDKSSTQPPEFHFDINRLDKRVSGRRTLAVAVQQKLRTWDALPPNFKKPYAVTTWCHIVELTAILRVFWTELDLARQIYRARGNGYTLVGENVTDLGVVFTLQLNGRNRFEENTILLVDEVKELCFGFVPTIFRDRTDASRIKSAESSSSCSTISTSTVKDIVRSLSVIGCNAAALNVFTTGGRVAHIFPLAFELMGMLGRNFYIKNGSFRLLPNPTSQPWDRVGFSMPLMVKAFSDRMNRMIRARGGKSSSVQASIFRLARRITKHADTIPGNFGHTGITSIPLLSQLHEAVDLSTSILTARNPKDRPTMKRVYVEGREKLQSVTKKNAGIDAEERRIMQAREKGRERMVLVCLRLHIQAVLAGLNKVTRAPQYTRTEQPSTENENEGSEESDCWGRLDLASPRSKQKRLMHIYFRRLRPLVVSQMDKSASRASLGDDMCNDGCDDDGESTDDEGGVEWMDDEFEEEYMDGEIYRPPSLWKLDDVSPEDIWCTLVFRSICWLMLHDFHPHDVNIVPTELFGSRIPVYIA